MDICDTRQCGNNLGVAHTHIHSITYISRQSVIIDTERTGVVDHCDRQRCSEQHSGGLCFVCSLRRASLKGREHIP